MFKFFYNFLRNIKSKIRQFFFLHKYRKDTPESTWKFYNQMKYLYRNEFIKRENFSNSIESSEYTKILDHKGFVKININDISKKEEFKNSLNKFRAKFDQINLNYEKDLQKKNYLIQYNFEFNNDAKNLADPFVDVVTKYLGTLPILDSLQMWYSPNESSELSGSRSLHRDPEDFKQVKIFIPIEEIQLENGPLNVINKDDSNLLYDYLVKKKVVNKRNQKIDDKYAKDLNLNSHKILLKNYECALVDTCACYHYGSRKSSKPRKILFLHFTSAFSAKTPIFRKYDIENKFFSDKDKLIYGLQKKTINHFKKRQYLTI